MGKIGSMGQLPPEALTAEKNLHRSAVQGVGVAVRILSTLLVCHSVSGRVCGVCLFVFSVGVGFRVYDLAVLWCRLGRYII